MTDYQQEQDMEIEALEAILMDDFREIRSSESDLVTSSRCFQITLSPQDNESDEPTGSSENYPDEPPLLKLKSLKGIQPGELKALKEKLEQEANDNLGMAMIYTLVASAKEWLSERYSHDSGLDDTTEDVSTKDEIVIPHGEPVTVDTFLAWREKYEAELALERAKLMPDSALTATKEKKLTGRQWFESGRAASKGGVPVEDVSDEDTEDIDFDDDFEDDEEDMLEHYLAEKSDSSAHSSRRGN